MNQFKKNYYVICSPTPNYEPALTKAEGKDEFCITIAESRERINLKNWLAKKMPWKDILKIIPDSTGILIIKEKSGSYIDSKNIKMLRTNI